MMTPEEKRKRQREASKKWRLANLDRVKAYAKDHGKKYYLANSEKVKLRQRVYSKQQRLLNPDKVRQYAREWRANNIERARKYSRKWYVKNREKIYERTKKWQQRNRQKGNRWSTEWRLRNPDKYHRSMRQWQLNNPDKVILNAQCRRARQRSAVIAFSVEDWMEIKKIFNHTCPSCGRKEPDIKLTVDHIVPLSKGGEHVKANIQPLCKSCNSRKHRYTRKWSPDGQIEMMF